MPRMHFVILFAVLLAGCSTPFTGVGMKDKEFIVGETRLFECPDFVIEDCTEEFPENLDGMMAVEGKVMYERLRITCKTDAQAMQGSQKRCKDFIKKHFK